MKIYKKEPDIHLFNYQLTDQDYKNITSRAFVKTWWIGLIFLTIFIGASYLTVKEITEKFIKQIIPEDLVQKQFAKYKEDLLNNTTNEIIEVKNSFINELKKYSTLPYSITANSLKLFDSSGNSIIFEFGKGKTSEVIKFKEFFTEKLYVVVSCSDPRSLLTRLFGVISFRITLNIKEISKEYFKVFYGTENTISKNIGQVEFNWIAIGH